MAFIPFKCSSVVMPSPFWTFQPQRTTLGLRHIVQRDPCVFYALLVRILRMAMDVAILAELGMAVGRKIFSMPLGCSWNAISSLSYVLLTLSLHD